MGHYNTERRRASRESKMYFLFILLISPAFGRPSSDQLDVGNEISNQFNDLVKFSNETGKLLNGSKLFGRVAESLRKADESILEMEASLTFFQSKIPALRGQGNYFPGYVKAKSLLRQTRQELDELAHRTVAEVKNMNFLLDDFDDGNDAVLLSFAIERMKALMVETQELLNKAKNIYNEARIAFENLKASVALQHKLLDKEILNKEKKQAQFEIDEDYTDSVSSTCSWLSWLTFGLCSLIHHFVNVIPLAEDRAELEALNSVTPVFLEKATALTEDIDDAIGAINTEIGLINRWEASAERVSQNIKLYPEESLKQFADVRTIFKNALVELDKNAKNFLAH